MDIILNPLPKARGTWRTRALAMEGIVSIELTLEELNEVQEEINQLRTDAVNLERIQQERLDIVIERDTLRKNLSEITAMLREENTILRNIVVQQHRQGDTDPDPDPKFKCCGLCGQLCSRDTLELDPERQQRFPAINNWFCQDCR